MSVEKTSRQRDPEAFDGDLEWMLVAGASAMRERGTLGAVINQLQLGGPQAGGTPNTDLYTDSQVGFGRHSIGEIERYRWLSGAWQKLEPKVQAILVVCYLAPAAELRTDQGFGARDQCPQVEDLKRGGVEEPNRGSHGQVHTGVEAQLGQLAGLAFWLTKDPAKLLIACREPSKRGGHALIKRCASEARKVAVEAHRLWREQKTGRPRSKRERVVVLPTLKPEDATP